MKFKSSFCRSIEAKLKEVDDKMVLLENLSSNFLPKYKAKPEYFKVKSPTSKSHKRTGGKRNGLGTLGVIGRKARNPEYLKSARSIARFMRKHKFNAKKLSHATGIHQTSIARYLTGETMPRVDVMNLIKSTK